MIFLLSLRLDMQGKDIREEPVFQKLTVQNNINFLHPQNCVIVHSHLENAFLSCCMHNGGSG